MALTDSLLAGYKFEEASGSRADVLGVKTLTENGTVTRDTGLIGFSASAFSTVNNLSNASPMVTADPFSFSLWFYLTSVAAAQTWYDSGGVTPQLNFTLTRGPLIEFKAGSATAQYVVTPTINTWHHVAGTASGTTAKLYYDGVYRATVSNSFSGTPTLFRFGSNGAQGAANTRLDSAYFWSKVLTDGSVAINNTAGGEVAQLFNGGVGIDYPFPVARGPLSGRSPLFAAQVVGRGSSLVQGAP